MTGPSETVIAANDSNVNVITIQNSNNVTIQGLNVTGAGTDRSGIYVYNSLNCKVKDNILHDDALGVYLRGSGYTVVSNNTATKSLLAGQGRAINIQQSNYTTVSNNRVANNNYGIYIVVSQANIVSGNTVNLSASSGIVMENSTNVTFDNNNLNSNGGHGIYMKYSNGNFLKNNNVFNSTNNSFEIYISSGNEISGNIVSDSSIDTLTHGIHLNTTYDNVLRNNVVSNNDYGIAIIYSNNTSVVNNTAFTNNRGIYLAYTSSANTVSDNDVYSNTNGGIVLQNCNNNNIVKNTARLNNGDVSYGIILGGANDNNVSNNNASGNRRAIYITSSSSGNTVSGNTLNSNTGHGILLENAGSNNNLSRNTISSNGGDGIYLVNSNNTYVLNNVAPSNLRGIEVSASYGNVVSNNTASNNVASGIRVSLSNNNTISGNTAYNDTYGIEFNSSRYNTVSSNNMTRSRTAGMFLCAQSRYNLIYNNYFNNTRNTANNNTECTWNVTKTAGRNIAGGPSLGGNFWGTPLLKDGFSQTHADNDTDGDGLIDTAYNGDNLIDYLPLKEVYVVLPYANFNTNATSGLVPLTVQFTDLSQNATGWSWDFGDGASSPDRNTTHTYSAAGNYTVTLTASNVNGTATKTAVITATGPSIIYPVADFSTSATSGYVPLSVTFTDLSQNAASVSWDVNGDGTEDSNVSSFTYEYASAGTYTAKLIATNANGTNEKTITITVKEEETHHSSSSSGGGGGGGGSPEPAKNVEVKEISQVFIANGKPIQFDFTKNATCVVYVGFDSKKTAGKTTTIAEQLKNKSTLVSNLTEGKVYKYFNVWVGNSGFASSANIENPVICFKVLKSWVQDNNIDKNSITLNRYSNKTWEQLPASQLREDSKYLYFTADVPGYTFFAITGKSNASSPDEDVTDIEPKDDPGNSQGNIGDTGSEAGNESGEEESKRTPGFGMVCGIVGLSAAFLYRRK